MKTYVITLSETFPKGNCQAGHPTNFVWQIENAYKIHTMRGNLPLWKKRFQKIEAGEACISLRVWTGKPYRSPQREIKRLYKEDGIGIEQVNIYNETAFTWQGDIDFEKLAKNDGLNRKQLIEWFGAKEFKELACIHFTPFRYWHTDGFLPLNDTTNIFIDGSETSKQLFLEGIELPELHKIYSRIKKVNKKLIESGMEHIEIVAFWDKCIKDASKLKPEEVPDYIKNQLAMDLDIEDTGNEIH